MVRVYYVKIDEEMEDIELSFLMSKISKLRRNETIRKKKKLDKIQRVVSELLVKFVLKEIYQVNIKKLKIIRGRYGKPFINVPIHFNISHSKNIILVAFSEKTEIGIDIEEIKQISITTLQKVFLKDEYEYIQCQEGQEQRLKVFYKFWTLKESYLKYLGVGLYRDMDTFGFTIGKIIALKDLLEPAYSDRVQFVTGNIENYSYSLCCNKEESIHKVECIEISQILNRI